MNRRQTYIININFFVTSLLFPLDDFFLHDYIYRTNMKPTAGGVLMCSLPVNRRVRHHQICWFDLNVLRLIVWLDLLIFPASLIGLFVMYGFCSFEEKTATIPTSFYFGVVSKIVVWKM